MGNYIRVLSPSRRVPALASLEAALAQENLAGTLTVVEGTENDWDQLLLSHADGTEIAAIERNAASGDDPGAEEIEEFLDEIADCKPASAAIWLAEYLPTIKTIYAFQVLHGTEIKNGRDLLGTVKNAIHSQVGGILQADDEGFSNPGGFHILWQFSSSVKGKWWMGVLQDGKWIHFQMDLGNKMHRESFFRGEVPPGAQLAE